MDSRAPIVAIVGATATGKSALSLRIAEVIGGEVVNADALQFYRGMDIGTAKLSITERRGVPHHQIDTLEVTEEASIARYQGEAREDVAAIHARGHRAVVVGGSGLYVRAVLDRLDFPATDPAVRARLEARAEREGPGTLYRELAAVDPEAAARISALNTRRIVRALEVTTITGRSYSASLPRREYALPAIQIGVRMSVESLDRRIDARSKRMWDGGLVEETQGLVESGLSEGKTAHRAVGYAEALRYLAGELSMDEARDLTAAKTRRLARRQMRWFMPDERVRWIEGAASPDDEERMVREALAVLGTLDP
jgi:tRNA dimethylallyltransferase